MALTKAGQIVLYAIASTASNVVTVGATLDVSTYYGGMVRIRMGRVTGTAFTAAPVIRLEASGVVAASVAADQWVTIGAFSPALGATIGLQAVSSGGTVASTAVTLAAGTNFVANDFVLFNNTTIANSEFKHVQSVSAAVLTLATGDGLVRSQATATASNQAEEYAINELGLIGINSLRIVVNGSTGTGQAVIVEAVLDPATGL